MVVTATVVIVAMAVKVVVVMTRAVEKGKRGIRGISQE